MTDGMRVTGDGAPPPQVVVQQMINGFRTTQMLYVAARLGIADLLADDPRSVDELAEAASANAGALYRILRGLAAFGVFTEVAPRQFGLTPQAELLRAGHPNSLRPLAIFMGEEPYRAWGDLLHTAHTGETAFDHVYGEPHFTWLAHHPEASATFNASMSGGSQRAASSILPAYDFAAAETIVDVGGGEGALLAAILRANPGPRGVLFDLDHVVAEARPALAAAGLAERCVTVAGDFFTTPPPAGDLYLLKNIIHDWDDARSLAILRNCAVAMPPGARIVLIELLIEPGNAPSLAKSLDLQMLVMNGGRQRTEEEYRQLYAAAGLRLTRVIPTASEFSLVEGERAE